MDNVFSEHLWRALKYKTMCLHKLPDGFATQRAIVKWLSFCNTKWTYSTLAGSTPADAYEQGQLTDRTSNAPLPAPPEQESVMNRTLAVCRTFVRHLISAAYLSQKMGRTI